MKVRKGWLQWGGRDHLQVKMLIFALKKHMEKLQTQGKQGKHRKFHFNLSVATRNSVQMGIVFETHLYLCCTTVANF